MSGKIECTKENLRVGCYHEIGHTLAALYLFPNKDIVSAICFQKLKGNKYELITTINPKFFEEIKGEIRKYAFFAMAGGVFQQMMYYYRQFTGNKQDLYQFLCDNVKSYIDGMEKDMENLDDALKEREAKGEIISLDYENIKNEIITSLLPRVGDRNIEEFCNRMINDIRLDTQYGQSSILDSDTISSYLCYNLY